MKILKMSVSSLALLLSVTVVLLGCDGDKGTGGSGGGGDGDGGGDGGNNTGENDVRIEVVDPSTVVKDSFVDIRDGQTYKTVKIGTQTWMAENLNRETADSWCYQNSVDSCAKYGRLYTWDVARTVCPSGWHLPTQDEWDYLAKSVGGQRSSRNDWEILYAGVKLKSRSGWRGGGNGTDDYGFSALPGGEHAARGGSYNAVYSGIWWTAVDNGNYAYGRIMNYLDDGVKQASREKTDGISVRCLKTD
jgi:uncharacterized protein (TIGR02145 family)